MSLATAALAEPASYLVFEIDRFDNVRLVHSELVELAGSPVSSLDAAEGTDDERLVDVVVRGESGAESHRASVTVERFVRSAEFPGNGAIACRPVENDRSYFVVRGPADASFAEVRVRRSGEAKTFALPPAAIAMSARVPAVTAAGSPSNRLDILIMGDGYTAADRVKFEQHADRAADKFFSVEPYATYRDSVNITRHFVASRESGADHPNCAEGGDDPLEGKFVDTAFDATYCTSGLQRLLTVNSGKVYQAAAAVPDWDFILILVNDTMYGGAGGGVMVASANDSAVGVVQHEFGHTFTRLADEYATPYPGYGTCSDVTGPRCEANVTDQKTRETIKWAPWIDPATPIPSPVGHPGIGLFEGARYQTAGMYRPAHVCLMNVLGAPFCSVCAQEFVLRLYGGWSGSPNGVDPIETVTPAPGTVNVTAEGTAVAFEATLLRASKDVHIEWLVDGAPVAGQTGATFVFAPTGTHTVELRVNDGTPLVHPAMARGAMESTRTWTVRLSTPGSRRRAVRK